MHKEDQAMNVQMKAAAVGSSGAKEARMPGELQELINLAQGLNVRAAGFLERLHNTNASVFGALPEEDGGLTSACPDGLVPEIRYHLYRMDQCFELIDDEISRLQTLQ